MSCVHDVAPLATGTVFAFEAWTGPFQSGARHLAWSTVATCCGSRLFWHYPSMQHESGINFLSSSRPRVPLVCCTSNPEDDALFFASSCSSVRLQNCFNEPEWEFVVVFSTHQGAFAQARRWLLASAQFAAVAENIVQQGSITIASFLWWFPSPARLKLHRRSAASSLQRPPCAAAAMAILWTHL